jgi:hypothetical protein
VIFTVAAVEITGAATVEKSKRAEAFLKSLFKLRWVFPPDIPCPTPPMWGSKRFISGFSYGANCLIGNK